MLEFKPVELKDREWLTARLKNSENRDCNLSFVNLYSWQFLTDSRYTWIGDDLVFRFFMNRERVVYLLPGKINDPQGVISTLIKQSTIEGDPLYIYGVFPELSVLLEQEFPGRFSFILNRDSFDYIYLRSDLIELKGKDFQPKRNHVNRFIKSYNYHYEPLTLELIPKCMELEEEWCILNDCEESKSLSNERKALNSALKRFNELELFGGTLWVEDQIVAFTYGAPITNDTFGVHIEKADTTINGAYNMINREFVKRIPEQYKYINREEDLGLAGLRKAKMSYRPVILLEKGYAELIL